MTLRCKLRQLRYDLRDWVMEYPILYYLFVNFGDRRGAIVNQETEIVIEGFPRSANTFAVNAFRLAQARDVQIAHHKHAIAQVITAIKRQIPVLILIRNPEDAVLSLVIREPCLSVQKGLQYYIHFYQKISKYKDNLVVADFEAVTADFGQIIQRINHKYQTDFIEFEHTKLNVDRCFHSMEQYSRKQFGQGKVVESMIPRPSEARQQAKENFKKDLNAEHLIELKSAALKLYQEFLA